MKVAVIGAGIMGLSTALELQKQRSDVEVTIVADRFTPDTVSDGAGALLRPIFLQDTKEADQVRWCKATLDFCYDLIRQGKQKDTGMMLCSGYDLSGTARPDPFWKSHVIGFRHADRSELAQLGPAWAEAAQAWYYTSVMIDSSTCLEWLQGECSQLGVQFQKRKIGSISDLYDDYDIVINCSGCGARSLAQDSTVTPARGVTVRLDAPWIKQFMIASDLPSFQPGEFAHIFPRSRMAVVGGIKQLENPSEVATDDEVASIVSRAALFDGSLKGAEVINTWAGHRPVRSCVRLEAETIRGRRAKCVIHNYGHGGSGLTIWQGCAEDVCRLVTRTYGLKAKL
eukprot:TRINITY_DN7331_c0_g1_i4.p1 TRINITY_DN7331_c0_g1~~TRINITY_DN7331_c0_g1_i4.p1  ORF type:complete len:341 (+),score=35.72 TRINITY_DN7331_c0_g1_i4:192-1214(+)